MRTIVQYFRQVFCQHDFIVDENQVEITNNGRFVKSDKKVYMRCKKCGWHTNHWKFL